MASPVKSPKTVSFQLHQHSRENVTSPLVTDSRAAQPLPVPKAPPDHPLKTLTASNGESTPNVDTAGNIAARPQTAVPSERGKALPDSIHGTHHKTPILPSSDSYAARMTSSEAARIAQQVRDKSSAVAHEHVRVLKYDVAKLREHLLKVEELVRVLSRGKGTLELAVQDVRKDLSTNQQSLDMQQKKSRNREVGIVQLGNFKNYHVY